MPGFIFQLQPTTNKSTFYYTSVKYPGNSEAKINKFEVIGNKR